MIRELTVPQAHCEEMLRFLRDAYPLEACGILAGLHGRVHRVYAVENLLRSPVAFEMEPQQQLQAMLELEEAGLEMLAIYHSHPMGPQTPSPTDVAKAYYPDVAHVIVSFSDRRSPSIRAFTIDEGVFDEIVLKIV
ncbi:MAG: Mov34/MPN/PAD-1 family protein [Chloroflexota bacterium]